MNSRNQRLHAAALVAAALLALAACKPNPGIDAEKAIRSYLGDDAKTVKVSIANGQATLSGAVALRSTRRIAPEIALTLPGIGSVDNQITVPERQKLESMYMDAVDAALESNVEQLLLRSVGPGVVSQLHLVAMEGIVSVRGQVADPEIHRRIVEVVGNMDDVRKIVDLLHVANAPTAATQQ